MNIPSGRFGLSGLRTRLMRLSAQHGLSLDLIGLVASGLLVHLLYLLHIDPAAGEALRIAAESGAVPERTPAIILKDIEQELCLILGLWCVWLLAFRYRLFQDEGYLLELDFLGLNELGAFGEAALDGIETRLAGAEAQLPDSLLLRCTRLALDRIRLGGTFRRPTRRPPKPAICSWKSSTPGCPSPNTSSGPSPRSAFSARCAASAKLWARPERPWPGTCPAWPPAWASPSTPPSWRCSSAWF